jgi:hypothetical protein
MTPKEFEKYIFRDRGCYHCGIPYDLIPHHRSNRGMGGARSADEPSNIIVMCAAINGLMESDPEMAELARTYGWKLSRYSNPEIQPVYDASTGFWFRLHNNYTRTPI